MRTKPNGQMAKPNGQMAKPNGQMAGGLNLLVYTKIIHWNHLDDLNWGPSPTFRQTQKFGNIPASNSSNTEALTIGFLDQPYWGCLDPGIP